MFVQNNLEWDEYSMAMLTNLVGFGGFCSTKSIDSENSRVQSVCCGGGFVFDYGKYSTSCVVMCSMGGPTHFWKCARRLTITAEL